MLLDDAVACIGYVIILNKAAVHDPKALDAAVHLALTSAWLPDELGWLRRYGGCPVSSRFCGHRVRAVHLDVKEKSGRRDLTYSVEQVAALLDAAASLGECQHVHLFAMIMLSTNGRVAAVLEHESLQVQDGLIYFNAPGRRPTKKRRSVVPICPTLAPWLAGRAGA